MKQLTKEQQAIVVLANKHKLLVVTPETVKSWKQEAKMQRIAAKRIIDPAECAKRAGKASAYELIISTVEFSRLLGPQPAQ